MNEEQFQNVMATIAQASIDASEGKGEVKDGSALHDALHELCRAVSDEEVGLEPRRAQNALPDEQRLNRIRDAWTSYDDLDLEPGDVEFVLDLAFDTLSMRRQRGYERQWVIKLRDTLERVLKNGASDTAASVLRAAFMVTSQWSKSCRTPPRLRPTSP